MAHDGDLEGHASANPQSAGAHYNLGVLDEAEGNLDAARARYTQARNLQAEDLNAQGVERVARVLGEQAALAGQVPQRLRVSPMGRRQDMAVRRQALAAWVLLGISACAGTLTPRSANPYIEDAQTADQRGTATVGTGATAVGVAVGVGASAARRAAGECYTPCVPGTACNPQTGLCDPLPCRGQCKPNERCDTSGVFPRCVDDGSRMSITPGGLDAGTP